MLKKLIIVIGILSLTGVANAVNVYQRTAIQNANGTDVSSTNPFPVTGNINGLIKNGTGTITSSNPLEVRTPHAVIISTVTAVTPVLSTWYSTAIPAGAQWIDMSGGQGNYDYDVTSNPKIIYGYYADQKIDLPASGATTIYYQQTVTTPNVQLKFKKWMN